MRFPWIRRSEHELHLENARNEVRRADASTAEAERRMNRLYDEGRDQIRRLEQRLSDVRSEVPAPTPCPACSAKDQTIALMADVVDFERARAVQMPQRPGAEAAVRVLPTRPEDVEERKWVTDDEEAIMGALQSGALGADAEEAYERASKMLAAIGAQNVEVQVVK